MPSRAELYVEGLPATIPSEHVLTFLSERAGASVADLGCGIGAYVKRLRETGREVVGIELDAEAVARAQSDGLDVRVGDVTALPYPDGAFETSVLVDVIEHVVDPERALAEALRVARRNVLVTVPNVAEYERLRAYGVTYWHLVTTDHLNFFTPEELQRHASRIGAHVDMRLAEPLEACALVPERGLWWYGLVFLARARLLRPIGWARIYAELTHADR
jgi:SAM-dependent methyltransferase